MTHTQLQLPTPQAQIVWNSNNQIFVAVETFVVEQEVLLVVVVLKSTVILLQILAHIVEDRLIKKLYVAISRIMPTLRARSVTP
jgi:hypothetical protein